MSEYFSKPKSLGSNVKVELYLYNYATKADLKNAAGVDTSDFAKKVALSNLKSDVDKLDIDKLKKNVPSGLSSLKSKADKLDIRKLETAPVNLSKLSNVVKSYSLNYDVNIDLLIYMELALSKYNMIFTD